MKIIRHTARDMRAAMRGVREQLGEDAVILSSRRTDDGVEITAAIDFDASTLEAGGFANTPIEPPPNMEAPVFAAPARAALAAPSRAAAIAKTPPTPAAAASRATAATNPTVLALTGGRGSRGTAPASGKLTLVSQSADQAAAAQPNAPQPAAAQRPMAQPARALQQAAVQPAPYEVAEQTADAPPSFYEVAGPPTAARPAFYEVAGQQPAAQPTTYEVAGQPTAARPAFYEVAGQQPAAQPTTYEVAGQPAAARPAFYEVAGQQPAAQPTTYEVAGQPAAARASLYEVADDPVAAPSTAYGDFGLPAYRGVDYDTGLISEAAREAVAELMAAPRAPVLAPAATQPLPAATPVAPTVPVAAVTPVAVTPVAVVPVASASSAPSAPMSPRPAARLLARVDDEADEHVETRRDDPVEEIREATLTPLASNEVKAAFAELKTTAEPGLAAADAMGNELKTLRRMLETQLAHLAWNDLTRRAPVHTEMLRELTEIGISQDLAEHLVRQLPEDTELTFARRFTIAGLSQYLKVTGDRWLDDGGRVAFTGATGVGKTTTLAKIAVRWVLRHGPRDLALVAGDSVRIGAQDQLQSLAQLLGVPVYTLEHFESLPSLLSQLNERLILIDTPGSSVRDPQLASRLAVLSNAASKLQTALVLAASTQAGAIEEAVKHFAPANPACCVLTKLDEAASLGGVLSVLIRTRLPVSYMSEGQRVPEDLRPARALELVSAAVRLAKASGAAADEDLLRRRFGRTAHGIS